jgi:hypothetical protein
MREEFAPLIKSCGTRPDSYRDVPAAETKSVGLQADPDATVGAGALVPCPPERPKYLAKAEDFFIGRAGKKRGTVTLR